MKSFRLQFLLLLSICTALFRTSSGATNFHDRHGNNFIYLDSISSNQYDTLSYAPVIWDIRSAFFQFRDYFASYGWDSSGDCDSAYNAIDLLLKEAWDHGVNSANVRSEISRLNSVQLLEPVSTHHFVNVARIVREDSLHLIAGGFRTGTSETSDDHNNAVISYLSDYNSWRVGPGEFIGVFGFDEPDARYEGPCWNQCQYDSIWYYLIKDYAQASRDSISGDILAFGTFLDRYKTMDRDRLYYQNTIPLFCGELEYPVFDYYPCKYSGPVNRSYPDQIEFYEIIGTTDLLPSDPVDYEAYADQDEIFAVDSNGWFRIYEFENVTSLTDPLEISRIDSVLLPRSLRDNPVWAASDFRAVDVGDRDSVSHRLNGAVVFFNPNDPNDHMIIFHDGSDVVFLEDTLKMPANAPEITTVGLGEYNYPVHHPTASSRRGSLISHGELRILVCYKSSEHEQILDRARVFAWNYHSDEFDDVTGDSSGLLLDIEPTRAIWGVFWPTYSWWHSYISEDQSGFLILDNSGNYQSIYEYTPQGSSAPEWTVSNKFTNLFKWDETSFIARRTWGFPCYTAGMDYICHLSEGAVEEKAVLEFASDPGGNPGRAMNVYESSSFDLPGSYAFSDINDAASCRPLEFYDDAMLISLDYGNDGSIVYRTTSHVDLCGGDGITVKLASNVDTLYGDESPLLAAARVYNVRQPYRVPLVSNPEEYPQQIELLNGDIPVENSWDCFAKIHESLDTMFVYGIDRTSRSNCLILNLRCEGRRQDGQLTFYPSSDSLLYLMTTSLVHGCRGIHLRALDLTMMCGNGGSSVPSSIYRCPSLLLNWGPGIETTNPDMIGRLYDVVQMLTGKNTSNPNFVSALIDNNYWILDSDDVCNTIQYGGWHQDIDNDYLNFIALEDSVSGDILLLVVNDSDDVLLGNAYIRFPNHLADLYITNWIAGFECSTDAQESVDRLLLDFNLISAYTASLYWFEHI